MTSSDEYDKREREILEHHRRCVQDERQRLAQQLAMLARNRQEGLQLLHLARAKATRPKLIRTQWGVLFA